MTNLEGRVIRRARAMAPPEGVRTDADVLHGIAARLGSSAAFAADAEAGFAELRRASSGGTADYAGISYERIAAEDGVFWPCPNDSHPGTPRLFLDRFGTEDGRARFHAVEHRPSAEEPDQAYPFWLTTGRVLSHYQSGAQTRRVPELAKAEPEPFVEIHPQTARGFGLADGDLARVTTRRGTIEVKARLTGTIRLDTLFVPFHWGDKGSANLLTHAALDPESRMPEFKVCAARIAPAHRASLPSVG